MSDTTEEKGSAKFSVLACQCSEHAWRHSCCNVILFVLGAGAILMALCKFPFHVGIAELPATNVTLDVDPPYTCTGLDNQSTWCNGMEHTPFLRSAGFRGLKMFADPQNFIAPHAAAGMTLVALWLSTLSGAYTYHDQAKYFFPLVSAFAIHVAPVAHGVPNRVAGGAPINELCIFICITGSVVAFWAWWLVEEQKRAEESQHWFNKLLRPCVQASTCLNPKKMMWWAWLWSVGAVMAAPIFDYFSTAQAIATKMGTGSWPAAPDGNYPLPESGRGPFASDSVWFGVLMAVVLLLTMFAVNIIHWIKIYKPELLPNAGDRPADQMVPL